MEQMKHCFALANTAFLVDWIPVFLLFQRSLTDVRYLWGAGITRPWALAKKLDIEESSSIKQPELQANASLICRYYIAPSVAGLTLGTALQ